MKQASVYDFYTLGKLLRSLSQWSSETVKAKVGLLARIANEQLTQASSDDSALLPASRDAIKEIIGSLDAAFGSQIRHGSFGVSSNTDSAGESEKEKLGVYFSIINSSIYKFETIFKADLPRMTVFGAEQKGIYRTESLIDSADQHFPASTRKRLPAQAKTDIIFAGKCLAFDTPTACAFHMWRALEIVIGAYYVSITNRTFEDDKVQRNWGGYIAALGKIGADKKITGNLDHIRAHYRNPTMHPTVNVTEDEAFSLFGIGISAITQVMQAIENQPNADAALA